MSQLILHIAPRTAIVDLDLWIVLESSCQQQVLTAGDAQPLTFESYAEQREHFKSDWHRYNVRRKLAGRLPLDEEEFERFLGENDEVRIARYHVDLPIVYSFMNSINSVFPTFKDYHVLEMNDVLTVPVVCKPIQ